MNEFNNLNKIIQYNLSVYRANDLWIVYKGMICAKHENLETAVDLLLTKLIA